MNTSINSIDYGAFFMDLPTPHVILQANEALTIAAQNHAHARISATKQVNTIGKPLLEAFPDISERYIKDGVSELVESFRRVIATGKPDAMPLFRYDLKGKNGTFAERWWQATHHPIFDNHKRVVYVYQSTEDVTNSVIKDQSIQRTSSQLQSALDVSLVSVWSWDIKGDIVTGDKNLARNFGVSVALAQKGLPLKTFTDSIHADDRTRVVDSIQHAVETTGVFTEEYRIVTKKNKIVWVKARGKVERDQDNKPLTITGILLDLTDQKKAESLLREAERRYSALFNSKTVAMAMAMIDGTVIEANTTFLRMFGYNKTDLKNGSISSKKLTYLKDDTSSKNLYKALIEFGEAEPIKKEYVRSDGSRFTGLVSAALLPGSSDTFMALILDVTENEQLKELNNAKDDFIALASHQLRTPASVVKQYLGVLLNELAGSLNEEQVQYVNIAYDANNRQIKLIEDLLKTVRLDMRGYDANMQRCNLVSLIYKAIEECEPIFDSRNQKLIFTLDQTTITGKADEIELGICINNLLENASKYTAGGKSVYVHIGLANKMAVITIKDEGVGIAKEHQKLVFDKFTRVDNELSDTVSGSGLGLYWVKRIVEIHGGQISLKSTLGKGTTITVRLPV